jgi:hypothetical protein
MKLSVEETACFFHELFSLFFNTVKSRDRPPLASPTSMVAFLCML